jgi:hypothetical protein
MMMYGNRQGSKVNPAYGNSSRRGQNRLFGKNLVAKKLDAFLGKRVPPHVVDKIRLSYTFRGNSVTIWDNRAPWTSSLTTWTTSAADEQVLHGPSFNPAHAH